jgi:hypothetical protein
MQLRQYKKINSSTIRYYEDEKLNNKIQLVSQSFPEYLILIREIIEPII